MLVSFSAGTSGGNSEADGKETGSNGRSRATFQPLSSALIAPPGSLWERVWSPPELSEPHRLHGQARTSLSQQPDIWL